MSHLKFRSKIFQIGTQLIFQQTDSESRRVRNYIVCLNDRQWLLKIAVRHGQHRGIELQHEASRSRRGKMNRSGYLWPESDAQMRHDLRSCRSSLFGDAASFSEAGTPQIRLRETHGSGTEERTHFKVRPITFAQ